MELFVDVADGVRLWTEQLGPPDADPLLVIMGANASGLIWPDALLERLAAEHRVIRYDHRDTGRSSWTFDDAPYAIADLAEDAVAVLDAWEIDRAHVVGMSMGGLLTQLLLLDHPDRLLTATLLCTRALEIAPGTCGSPEDTDAPEPLPGPEPALLRLWQEIDDPRDRAGELRWRLEHWRLLHGGGVPFDPFAFRRLEERVLEHTGHTDSPVAHTLADPDGLDRGAELARVDVPTLVIEAPEDPVNPPPHAEHLAGLIPGADLIQIPGLGHALAAVLVEPVAEAILSRTAPVGAWTAPEPDGVSTP